MSPPKDTDKEAARRTDGGPQLRLKVDKGHRPAGLAANRGPLRRPTRRAVSNRSELRGPGGEIVGIAGVSGNGQPSCSACSAASSSRAKGGFTIAAASTPEPSGRSGAGAQLRPRPCPGRQTQDGADQPFEAKEAIHPAITRKPVQPGLAATEAIRAGLPGQRWTRGRAPAESPELVANFSAATSRSWCWPGKWSRTRYLLVGQPTRGVDIGAIEAIHQQITPLTATRARRCCWCRSSWTRS